MSMIGNLAALKEHRASAHEIFNLVADELVLVEAEFELRARSNIGVIASINDYLRASGGKRVRPALTLLSVYAAGGDAKQYNSIRMAAVMELLHTATLVHDDIIDNAETRRNQVSVNSRFGNQTAVLIGDWLYMSAFETSLAERSLPILDILTSVTRKMTEGELLQLTLLGRVDITENQYFDVLQRKTAYLFSACCEIGAILGHADARTQTAMRDYGMHLGTAFQLIDDLLDFTSSGEELGKAAGVDLLEGKLTLPLIYLLQQDSTLRAAVQTVIRDGDYRAMPREVLLDAVEQSGALQRARERAVQCADSARAGIDSLPRSVYSDALKMLPTYIVERDH
ncbi:MAG: polyprenyl synthetase family protein [Pyrinomonadaceae bacterium]